MECSLTNRRCNLRDRFSKMKSGPCIVILFPHRARVSVFPHFHPLGRVFLHIVADLQVFRLIANHTLIEGRLKELSSGSMVALIAAACGQRLPRADHIRQRRAGACPRRLVQVYDYMDVSGHDDVSVNLHMGITCFQRQ